MEGSFCIDEWEYRFVTIPDDADAEGLGLAVNVGDAEDAAEVAATVRRYAIGAFWYLDPAFRQQRLLEAAVVHMEASWDVPVYNFMDRRLTGAEIDCIATALVGYRASLRETERWKVRTVLISGTQPVNEATGSHMLGEANLERGLFTLYPAAMRMGPYRGIAFWNTLTAVVQHEASHLCVERDLFPAWEQHAERLGWELTPRGTLLLLPGGKETRFLQRRPQECPTPYAALIPDEDRCETAAAYVSARRVLNPVRQELAATMFLPQPRRVPQPTWSMRRPELPRFAEPLVVRLSEGGFRPLGVVHEPEAVEIVTIPLDEYRAQIAAR